jgi:8-oxo-dGTP pyrophosphatase MutT (NUDIX family)
VHVAGKVLLLRRVKTGWKDGCYSLPAGGHDGREPLPVAAARELKEETGLIANPESMRLTHLLHCGSGESDAEWLGAFFTAAAWSGTPRLVEPEKHDHIGWFPVNDLPTEIIPYTRQGIEASMAGTPFSSFGWPKHDVTSFSVPALILP